MIFDKEERVNTHSTPTKKLYLNFEHLNKLTTGQKKNWAIQYAMGYFVLNKIQITDEDFKKMKEDIKIYFEKIEKVQP